MRSSVTSMCPRTRSRPAWSNTQPSRPGTRGPKNSVIARARAAGSITCSSPGTAGDVIPGSRIRRGARRGAWTPTLRAARAQRRRYGRSPDEVRASRPGLRIARRTVRVELPGPLLVLGRLGSVALGLQRLLLGRGRLTLGPGRALLGFGRSTVRLELADARLVVVRAGLDAALLGAAGARAEREHGEQGQHGDGDDDEDDDHFGVHVPPWVGGRVVPSVPSVTLRDERE